MNVFQRFIRGIVDKKQRNLGSATAGIPMLDQFDCPVYAVGDVHGCCSLYRELETAILRDADLFNLPPTIVLLGDMVDRGLHTAALIDHLLRTPQGNMHRLSLMGNHEAMMLDYLDSPAANVHWLQAGGYETLMSYGVPHSIKTLKHMSERKLRQTIVAHIPKDHIRFLRGLLPGLQVGPYLLAHAGADVAAPLTQQPLQALLWGEAGRVPPDDLTLIHGHYVTPAPDCQPHSIGIDTGAYATGRLTALRLMKNQRPAKMTAKEDAGFTALPCDE